MKTKFFKKLSFVLVVAMVLSLFVPAAGAFAAAGPKLNSTNKYLHLGVDKLEEFNFNISNKLKGWKYHWESANENVAVVNEKNGVTVATGVGKTKITVDITDLDKNTITLSATVTVRDNIETVTIKNPVDTLGVGEEHDYNRDFVTVSGSTKKTGAITRWTVEPSETATIDDKGVFVATEAGEYTITANSFQSGARYKNWLEDADKYADEVLATDETTVVVAGSMLEAKQTTLDTFKVTFDSAMEDIDKNISVYQMVGNTKVNQTVKSVKVADDKMSADVTVYVAFNPESTYVVDYTDLDSVSFVAATTDVEDVVALQITTSVAELNNATPVKYKLLTATGVDITGASKLAGRVTMKSSGGVGTFFNAANNVQAVTIFTKDAMTTITATFHTYSYDNTGKENVIEAAGLIVGVESAAQNITGLNSWTIVDDNDPDFDDTNQTIAVEDSGYTLFVKFNTMTGDDADDIDSKTDDKFTFQSSDTSVLIVNASTGQLFPVKQGSVVVVVKYGDTTVGAIELTVMPKRIAGEFTLSTYKVILSNATNVDDEAEVELKVLDNLGTKFEVTSHKIEKLDGSASGAPLTEVTDGGGNKLVVKGKDQANGTYYYRITVAERVAVLEVVIQDGKTDTAVTNYRVQLGAGSVDLKFKDEDTAKGIDIDLFGYNKSGVKVSKGTAGIVDGRAYEISVKAPDTWAGTLVGNRYTLATSGAATSTTSGGAIAKAPKGSYEVTAKVILEGATELVPVDVVYFTVTDTQLVPTLTKVKDRMFTDAVVITDQDSLLKAVKECFEFKLDGTEVFAREVEVFGTKDQFNVLKVKIRQTFDNGSYIDHEVSVGYTISKK